MRNRSIPSSTSTGHTASRNTAAKTSVPSDVLGAAFLVANATAKWPMNMSIVLPEQRFLQAAGHRVAAEPDPEQRTVEILPDDGLALRLAVQHDARPGPWQPVERDEIALFRRLQRVHDGDELGLAGLQRLLLTHGVLSRMPSSRASANCLALRSRIRRMLMRFAPGSASTSVALVFFSAR